uniref:CSON003238 protein n=1 Tax=Culicoides sonorensis TaxID=179676 RepID=A0A336LT09_CULSO
MTPSSSVSNLSAFNCIQIANLSSTGRKNVTQTCKPPFSSIIPDVLMSVPRPAILVAMITSPAFNSA